MKKGIKYSLIFLLVCIPIWGVIDGFIIKKIIIRQAEHAIHKKVFLDKVNIHYFPNLSLELINLKLPNPTQDNYLIVANKLSININAIALLYKALVIEEITANNTHFLDTKTLPIPLKRTTKIDAEEEEENKKVSSKLVLKDSLQSIVNNIVDTFNISDIKSNVSGTLDFNTETNKVDHIISSANSQINTKKDIILTKTNTLLYEINGIKIDQLNSIASINDARQRITKVSNTSSDLIEEIDNVDTIFTSSEQELRRLEQTVSNKIDNAFSLEIIEKNSGITSVLFSDQVKGIITNLIKKNQKKKENQKKTRKVVGKTYSFRTVKYPKFIIKICDINPKNSVNYIRGRHLGLDQNIKEPLKLNVNIGKTQLFKQLNIQINSTNRTHYQIDNTYIKGLKLAQQKLFEDSDVSVNFLQNNTTNVSFIGTIAPSSSIITSIVIQKPTYRIIQTSTKQSLLTTFFHQLDQKEIQLDVMATGPVNALNVNVDTNIIDLINEVKDGVLADKIDAIKATQEEKIEHLKKEELGGIQQKQTAFNKSYQDSINQIKFQLNEVDVQKAAIQQKIDDKKKAVENKVKSEAAKKLKTATKDTLKSLKLF
jgi:hypothetical protein